MPGPGLSPVFALALAREVSLKPGDSPGPGFTIFIGAENE
jgi:hypothetical protein